MVVLTVSAAKARAARHGRARALVLLVVHLVIAAHIAHWLLAGRTVAPLELNESMYTLERGVITVGGILMALIVLSVFVFGRFFCSWGCHVLALQDGAAWLLERVGIRPRPVRSRLAPLVGLSVAFYMFAWPQVERLWFKQPWAGLARRFLCAAEFLCGCWERGRSVASPVHMARHFPSSIEFRLAAFD